MAVDRLILILAWMCSFAALGFCASRGRLREAALHLLFNQAITWAVSLLFVEMHWTENPVREFPRAIDNNFTFNYILYPTVAAMYCLYYPQRKSRLRKFIYVLLFVSGLSLFYFLVNRYTDLIEFKAYNMYMFVPLCYLALAFTRLYGKWFFKGLGAPMKGKVDPHDR